MARRQAGVEQHLHQQRGAERRRLRRLDDDGVAGRQRGRDLVRDHVQRRVERRDAADHAARHPDRERHPVRVAGRGLDRHHLADQPLGFLGGDDEGLRGAADLVLGVDIGNPASATIVRASRSRRSSMSVDAFINSL